MTPPLRDPAAYVWLPELDAGAPEPPPPGSAEIHAVHFRRTAVEDDVVRSVELETATGLRPLPRRIQHHGDPEEGWDWGWRGSAPLETSLNVLAAFVHPRAAWRLHWAFCEAFLHPLPAAGGTAAAEEIRGWLRENAWIGQQASWLTSPGIARRSRLARERAESRRLSPADRAERCARLVVSALRWDAGDQRDAACSATGAVDPGDPDAPGTAGFQLARAAAVLAGAPPAGRWATLHALAQRLPAPGGLLRQAWSREAAPCTPGLPGPEATETVARAWALYGGKGPAERAALAATLLRSEADGPTGRWTSIPLLALPLGAGFEQAYRGEEYLAGDPVAAAGTLHALHAQLQRDPALRTSAERLGLTLHDVCSRLVAAGNLHAWTLGAARREAEQGVAAVLERVRAAHAARLPRGRSPLPAPGSPALRRWVMAVPEHVLLHLARAVRGPAGPLTVRAALAAEGLHFPDPPGTVAQTITWYLEERAPAVLDVPSFPGRPDGLFRTPSAPPAGAPGPLS